MKTKSILVMLVVLMTTAISCRKFVDVTPPTTEILTSEAFSTDASGISAVLGIYTNMQNDNNFINSGITVNGGLYADELLQFRTNSALAEFQASNILPVNTTLYSMWTAAYKNIAYINTCIAGIKASNGLTPATKAQLLGESELLRAFHYFYLVNLWGNIPLVTTTDYRVNATLGQSSPTDVYNLMVADLTDAQSNLVAAYPTTGRVRANKWAAATLLARIYLYGNDYVNAEAQASAVISSGSYSLAALNNAFLVGSNEAIWQLLPTGVFSATQEGAGFLNNIATGSANYYFTTDLYNSFETGDNRKTSWINSIVNTGKTYYYPYKYKDVGVSGAGSTIKENYIMLRFAELYLIRAEARAQQNNLTGAISDLNTIRSRAGLANTTAITQATLLNAIGDENRHEFFAEWGHRLLDLKRIGKANAVLSVLKPTTWKATNVLFPIPQNDINVDGQLVQNPGY